MFKSQELSGAWVSISSSRTCREQLESAPGKAWRCRRSSGTPGSSSRYVVIFSRVVTINRADFISVGHSMIEHSLTIRRPSKFILCAIASRTAICHASGPRLLGLGHPTPPHITKVNSRCLLRDFRRQEPRAFLRNDISRTPDWPRDAAGISSVRLSYSNREST